MSKKAKKQEDEMTFLERVLDYQVLSEEERDGYKYATLRTHSGAIVNCRIPIHTEEEKRELGGKIAVAMTRMCFPDRDLSQCKRIEVVI